MADYDSIDFFTDPAIVNDTPAYLAHLRSQCPVLREPFHGAFMVTGYDEAMAVFNQQGEVFSSAVAVTGPVPPLPFTAPRCRGRIIWRRWMPPNTPAIARC